jgi:hypothetical protein
MASRKTYFGIGLPKDPTDPQSAVDSADQSSPTVVDDQKVAEGLQQLRNWYQSDANEDDTRRVVGQTAPAPTATGSLPQARPTAVGHATGDGPPQTQRPAAPDPMRATMFGHDIHRLDFDEALSAFDSHVSATAIPVDVPPVQKPSPRPRYEAPRPQAERIPQAAAPLPSGPSQLAEYLRRQADRPHEPGSFRVSSLDDTDTHEVPRVPLMARLVLVAGVAALTVAALLSIQSRSSHVPTALPSNAAPPLSLPAPPTGTARTALPGAGEPTETSPTAPAKSVRSAPAPAPTVAPRTARPAPAAARPAPRTKPRIVEPQTADGDDLASPPPASESVPSPIGAPSEGKDVSPPEQTAPPDRRAPMRKKADSAGPSAKSRIRDVDATMPPSLE